MLHSKCKWAGKTILHLCTVSSESFLVIYDQYCVWEREQGIFQWELTCAQPPLSRRWSHMFRIMYVSMEDSDETALVHSRLWAFPDHLCSVLDVCEPGRLRRDYTCAQSPLSLPGPLMLRIGCIRAGKIETRLHLCTVSPEPSRTT